MKIKSYNFLIWVLFYLIVFTMLLNQSFNHLDPDLGWHLKVGEAIVAEKAVPNYENYNYTLEGQTWVDHEWLANALSFLLYDKFSYIALAFFFSLLVIATLILQRHFITTYITPDKKTYYFLMILQFIGIAASLPHFGVRMQIITLLNLQILILILHKYSIQKNPRSLFWLLPLFYLWSCLHAGFLIGIVIIFFYSGVKFIEYLSKRFYQLNWIDYSDVFTLREIILVIIFAMFTTLSTLITPYGFKLYSFLQSYSNTFYAKIISEWTPFHYLPIQYKQLFYAAIIASALTLLAILFIGKNKEKKYKINLWYFLITLVFFILAFKSKRHFPLFYVVSLPLTISVFYHYFSLPDFFRKYVYKNRLARLFLLSGFLITILNFTGKINFTEDPFRSKLLCRENPCAAVDFLKTNSEYAELKIFNNYGWGGYMIWEMPEKKLFIDGRLPQYKFNEHTLLEDYLEFFDKEKLEYKLNDLNIELVLLKLNQDVKFNWFEKRFLKLSEEEYNNQKIALKEYLDNSTDWQLKYEDKLSNVYVKTKN